jgi:hypothetical protein
MRGDNTWNPLDRGILYQVLEILVKIVNAEHNGLKMRSWSIQLGSTIPSGSCNGMAVAEAW